MPVANESIEEVTLKAWIQNGMLHVSGLSKGKPWYVYNLNGMLVYSGIATEDKAIIALPQRGIYIIRSSNGTKWESTYVGVCM